MLAAASVLVAAAVLAGMAPPPTKINIPAWGTEMTSANHCVEVQDHIPPGLSPPPGPPGKCWRPPCPPDPPPPKPFTVKNDSRWAFTAVPKGTPPSGGWPVLIDLAIIDYTPVATNGDDEPKKCGLDGLFPPGENPGFRRRQLQSEAARPPSAACTAALVAQCGAQKKSGHSACSSCIKSKYRILEKAGCGFFDLEGYCGGKKPAPHPNPGGGGMTEEYAAFATPEELMGACSCFEKNGTYGCPTTADNGHHESPGTGCSFDMLAGVMWFQRQKQLLLANGIAVMVVNTRTFDGWSIDMPSYTTGEDPAFFKQLSADIAGGKLGPINQKRVAFHGWSGGAQMVSNVVNIWAEGKLADFEVKAGVMLSGGTHQCYNIGERAQAQCKGCDPSEECMTPGCSAKGPGNPTGINPDWPNNKVCCYMCCPQGLTETYYQQHPEDYAKHPAMFLGQVSTDDNEADGCAAQYYHDTMQAHNATSELHLVPLERQRCYCTGQPTDPAISGSPVGLGDNYSRYCASQDPATGGMLNCMNHTVGAAEMVEPLVRFLLKAL